MSNGTVMIRDAKKLDDIALENWIDLLLHFPTDWISHEDFIMIYSPYLLGTCRRVDEPLFTLLYGLTLLPGNFLNIIWNVRRCEHILMDIAHTQLVARQFCKDVLGKNAARKLPGGKFGSEVKQYDPLTRGVLTYLDRLLTRPSGYELEVVKAESELWKAVLKMLTWMSAITWMWEHPVILFAEIIKERSLVLFSNELTSNDMTLSQLRKRWQMENRRLSRTHEADKTKHCLIKSHRSPQTYESEQRNPFDPHCSPTTYRVIQQALELEGHYGGGNFRAEFYRPVYEKRMDLTQLLLKKGSHYRYIDGRRQVPQK